MDFARYLHLMDRVDWLLLGHPDFLLLLDETHLEVLKRGFLFDVPDERYPTSIADYFEQEVEANPELQVGMENAVSALLAAAGVSARDRP